ncbi:hypothetical protein EVAR_55211_1 [Eumeta japonica]|uniref:Uncharacterized protein n=1 Tax=Eumeta variegata TaxID=151549 RepID=A0A4C1ZS03_EUMVA|nr:hypothetical protein EVAR_55211_1 [Eumeta japonica]
MSRYAGVRLSSHSGSKVMSVSLIQRHISICRRAAARDFARLFFNLLPVRWKLFVNNLTRRGCGPGDFRSPRLIPKAQTPRPGRLPCTPHSAPQHPPTPHVYPRPD